MPSITEINSNREKKKFKKRTYRPWNLEGESSTVIKEDLTPESTTLASFPKDSVISLSPDLISNWEFHDRPEEELGNIKALADEFKEIGQQQPCIVRPTENSSKYELIVGERRWRAAQLAGLDVKAIVKKISDKDAAIIQASENSSRKDLSDYARGMSYARLINKEVLTQKDLIDKLSLSKQQVSRLLSFSKIPTVVRDAIQDLSKISSRTAEQIKQLCNKGDNYIAAVIHYADLLKEGKIGQTKLKELVEKYTSKKTPSKSPTKKLYSRDGRLLLTWRREKDLYLSAHFPKDITSLIEKEKIDIDLINTELRKVIENALKNI